MTGLDKSTRSLWAKKEDKGSRFFWLPLIVHLTDTMNTARWLWTNWISDRQRALCINSINPSNEETAQNLAAFLGAVHDIGKATPAFQTQQGFQYSADLDHRLLERLERAGFSGISLLHLSDPRKTPHSVAGEYLLKKAFHVRDDIGSIIGGHHGKPVDDPFCVEDQSAYVGNYFQSEDNHSEVYMKWKCAQEEIFQWACSSSGFSGSESLPEISQPAQVIYSGLLIMADWISSNTEYFPLIDIDAEDVPDMNARYQRGITAWCADLPLQIQNYSSMDDLFRKRFGFLPRNFQEVVYTTISRINKPGIIILEAPMGLGKTEAALAAAEEVAAKTGSSGLFFGLPTQATSNSMFGRVYQWLETLTEEYGVNQSLRLNHGKAALNEDMNKLRDYSSSKDINIDDSTAGSVFVNEWFEGRKKTALDDFVVGTVDGFLLTALKQKHLALRHLGFSKKVIIIDEVHAYDTYMQQYLEKAIQWMGAYRTPVILVSATLPEEKRKCLIAAYLKGMGVKRREIVFPESMTGTSYPLISYTEGREVQAQADFLPMEDKTVHIKKLREEELLDKIDELLRGGGVIGVIVNTVRKAQKLGNECKRRFGENTVDVLHSAFIAADRVNKEADLMKMIGKHGKRPSKKIIIGTQVIEQSLDIDFDVLITDLCPVDLLLQRIGRLHRHDIQRPERHREPSAYVMGTNDQLDFDKGSERIYGKYFLIRTQYCLPNEIHIPSDIPILINKVYGEEEPDYQGDLQQIYRESREQMEILKKKKADKALTYRIDSPREKMNPARNNLIGWLKDPDYSKSDETASAQVRDIVETVEVIALKKTGSGYGIFDKDTDLSGMIEQPQVAKEIAKQTLRLPSFVTMRLGVSRTIEFLEEYNRKYLSDWQNQPWLEGTLGIIFNEDGYFHLDGILLKYDHQFGLREEKENEKI